MRPIDYAGNHRADGRRCRHQPARSSILIKQASAEHHADDQRQLHHSIGQHPGPPYDQTVTVAYPSLRSFQNASIVV